MATILIGALAVNILYRAEISEQRAKLEAAAKGQARLIEAMVRGNKLNRESSFDRKSKAILEQLQKAHTKYNGFGTASEISLFRKENNQITFLLSHRQKNVERPEPILWDSPRADMFQMALLGKSGTIIGQDDRGEEVVAAYEPVIGMNLGIVIRITLTEIKN